MISRDEEIPEVVELPIVAHFRLADGSGGGWGATLVTLYRTETSI